MTLYDRSVDLMVKLEAAQSADANEELLNRGRTVAVALEGYATYLDAVTEFRDGAAVHTRPELDAKQIAQAVGAFRAGLSRHGATAIQHQPAATLLDVAKAQTERAARWARGCWKGCFAEVQPLLDKEGSGELVGGGSQRMAIQSGAAKLRAALALDPIKDASEITRHLGGLDVATWIENINGRRVELQRAIEDLERERDALTPEVRAALQRAASPGGFPLAELTADLLSQLGTAGVVGDLTVRRT